MPTGDHWSDPAQLELGRYIGPAAPGDGLHKRARCPAGEVLQCSCSQMTSKQSDFAISQEDGNGTNPQSEYFCLVSTPVSPRFRPATLRIAVLIRSGQRRIGRRARHCLSSFQRSRSALAESVTCRSWGSVFDIE